MLKAVAGLFEKKVTIFKKKDRAAWQRIKDALKEAGVNGVRAGHYPVESLYSCGCGSQLDPRNFGAKGRIDRDVYFIDVKKDDVSKAQAIIEEHGLQAVVDEDVVGRVVRL